MQKNTIEIVTTREPNPQVLKKAMESVLRLDSITASDFMRAPHLNEMWGRCAAHGESLSRAFETLCVVGIGGSSLGTKVIQQFLIQSHKQDRELLFFENVDPVAFAVKLQKIKSFEQCHWLIVSKSGKTIETLSQLSLVLKKYKSNEYSKHFSVISDPGTNPLTAWAQQNQVVELNIPKNIGGRFSVLTAVGLVPSAYLGMDLKSLQKGALRASQDKELVARSVAQAIESFNREEWVSVFWGYSDMLSNFGGWIQQLWAESLSKKMTREAQIAKRVSTPLCLVGANDQHSILQQLMEGARDKFIWFLGVASIEASGEPISDVVGLPEFINGKTLGSILKAERISTRQALKSEGVDSIEIMIRDLSPESLGYMFQYFEMVVASIAEYLDIDAFDQPGVELGKRLAMQILSQE